MAILKIGDREFEEVVVDWPDGVDSVEGTITYTGDNFARSRGWNAPHPTLDQTNMVWPEFYIENDIPVFSKDVIRLDRRRYWVDDVYIKWLGFDMWSQYCQPAIWRQDTNEPDTDPINGVWKEQTIDCGCNLHQLDGEPFWTNKGLYWKIKGVSYFSVIDINEINYKLTPHLVTKQTLASISSREPVAYITHQKWGDMVVPKIFEHQLIMSDGQLERFPSIPFVTRYLGHPTTILGYCFQSSKVFGLFPDGKWRIIEESKITGIGSAYFDRVVYVDKWVDTPPPTIKGWTRGLDEKFDWQVE